MPHEPIAEDLTAFRADLAALIELGRDLLRSGVLRQTPRPWSSELTRFLQERERLRLRLDGVSQPLALALAYSPLPASWAFAVIASAIDADLFDRSPRLYDDMVRRSLLYLDEAIAWQRRQRRVRRLVESGLRRWTAWRGH